jgi:hypothetical protein
VTLLVYGEVDAGMRIVNLPGLAEADVSQSDGTIDEED